jgi:hypothetical protein
MPSNKAIIESFGVLGAAAVQGGPADKGQIDAAAKVWGMVLGDLSDADLEKAVLAYLRDEKVCQFWPQPGVLLARAPGRKPPIDDSSEAWGEAAAWIRDSRNAVGILYTAGYTDRAPWAEGAPVREGQPVRDQVRDAAIRAGIRAMGGCSALLNLGDRDLSSDTEAGLRKAFRDAYTSSKTTGLRAAADQAITVLTGGGARQIERRGPEPIGRSLLSTVPADRPAAR